VFWGEGLVLRAKVGRRGKDVGSVLGLIFIFSSQ
jgi:hypothetical protein